jgi:hypothetical protein
MLLVRERVSAVVCVELVCTVDISLFALLLPSAAARAEVNFASTEIFRLLSLFSLPRYLLLLHYLVCVEGYLSGCP